METVEKPKIESKSATVRVPRHGALIAREKRALPELTKQIEENRRKARLSVIQMRHRYIWATRRIYLWASYLYLHLLCF